MRSRRIQFFSFINAFNVAYQGRLPFVDIKMVSPKILSFIQCLYFDGLIQTYSLLSQKQAHKTPARYVRIYFRYTINQRLLFKRILLANRRNAVTHAGLIRWLARKGSLVFPILFLETGVLGIRTDRQCLFIRLRQKQKKYYSGRLLAYISE